MTPTSFSWPASFCHLLTLISKLLLTFLNRLSLCNYLPLAVAAASTTHLTSPHAQISCVAVSSSWDMGVDNFLVTFPSTYFLLLSHPQIFFSRKLLLF